MYPQVVKKEFGHELCLPSLVRPMTGPQYAVEQAK